MASSASLYGDRDPSKTKTKHKPISSSSSLAFSSNLSSLIASSKSKPAHSTTKDTSKTAGRARDSVSTSSSAPKASLFTAHRESKSSKKRPRDSSPEQIHKTSLDVGRTDAADLARSKRKMLEKTRLYNAMKRGEYIGREGDYDGGLMVDFDKKWAESHTSPTHSEDEDLGSDSDASEAAEPGSKNNTKPEAKTETYTDEFGRLIPCTPSQKRRHERRTRIAALAAASLTDYQARPVAPESQLIYGDAIQTAAFNPDHVTATKMAELAAKRDRGATPPQETHYDGKAEIRTRGTGWFGFSKDEEVRKEEMAGLESERRETERVRAERQVEEEKRQAEREEALQRRRKEVEERRRIVEEKRRGREVDAFLEGLEGVVPLGGGNGVGGAAGDGGGNKDGVQKAGETEDAA